MSVRATPRTTWIGVMLSLVDCGSSATDPAGSGPSLSVDASTSGDAGVAADTSRLAAETQTDRVFRTVGAKALAGDLYLPDRTTPVAAVVLVHGGGFTSGDKAGYSEKLWTAHLQANGFAAFSVNYRLYGDFSHEVPFPAVVGDLKCAIMWLRQNAARYRIDPAHVFVLGGSAGGFMSNFLGTTGDVPDFTPTDCADGASASNRLQGVVTYYGPSDWNTEMNDPVRAGTTKDEKKFIGLHGDNPCAPGSSESTGICTTASATTYIDAGDPPFFISHSDDDPVVPVGQSRLMNTLLAAAQVDVTYREVTGLRHGWIADFRDPVASSVRDEVTAWLKARQR